MEYVHARISINNELPIPGAARDLPQVFRLSADKSAKATKESVDKSANKTKESADKAAKQSKEAAEKAKHSAEKATQQ